MAFGSCRTSVGHDATGNAHPRRRRAAQPRAEDGRPTPTVRWPDLVLFLGDQVYADETTEEMQEFIRSRRDIERAAGQGAQGLRGVRPPLQARVERPAEPLAALDAAELDDLRRPRRPRRLEHVVRLEAGDREDRLVARAGSSPGSASYWVYQHLGQPLAGGARATTRCGSRSSATRATTPSSTSPSGWTARPSGSTSSRRASGGATRREFGDVRLVVVDARAARVLEPGPPRPARPGGEAVARRAAARRRASTC